MSFGVEDELISAVMFDLPNIIGRMNQITILQNLSKQKAILEIHKTSTTWLIHIV